jgi:hypothetical protein
MTTRTIQDIYDDNRENTNRIEELKELLDRICSELKIRGEKGKKIEDELKDMMTDLIKEKKISWVECDLSEWRKYIENQDEFSDDYDRATYYIYYSDGYINDQGYFKGVHNLSKKDKAHFDKFINDYFYYGYPMYIDRNHPHAQATECEIAFGGGDSYYKEFNWEF